MGQLLDRAIQFAVQMHAGQLRKGCDIPYILHPLETAAIVATMTTDDAVLAAAVLHDTVEDTAATAEQIRALFGDRVALLVAGESENKREHLSAESTWKTRKQETIDHLKDAPREVKMITLGDKLSNIRSMYRDHQFLGEELWQRFNQKDKNEHRWYYQSIADNLSELQDYEAYKELGELIEKTFGAQP